MSEEKERKGVKKKNVKLIHHVKVVLILLLKTFLFRKYLDILVLLSEIYND